MFSSDMFGEIGLGDFRLERTYLAGIFFYLRALVRCLHMAPQAHRRHSFITDLALRLDSSVYCVHVILDAALVGEYVIALTTLIYLSFVF